MFPKMTKKTGIVEILYWGSTHRIPLLYIKFSRP